MIRQINNAATHHSTARMAARQTAKASTDANPFRSVLDSTSSSSTPVSPLLATAASLQTPQITATISKSVVPAVNPAVTLSPPVFQQGATVTNPDGSSSALNSMEFAAPQTAQQIAAKLGGTVDEGNIPGFSTSQLSIRVPGSNNLVNAGVAAQLFAQYGDKPGSQAWQIINRDIGRDPMST